MRRPSPHAVAAGDRDRGRVFISSGLTRLDVHGAQLVRLAVHALVFGIRQRSFGRTSCVGLPRENVRAEMPSSDTSGARESLVTPTNSSISTPPSCDAKSIANSAINDTLHLLNTGRYEVGRIGENDLLQSELAVLRARTSLDGARLERERAMAELRRLTSLPAGEEINVVVPASAPDVQPDTAVAVAQALRNRAQMRALELDELVARRGVSQARLNTGFGMTVNAMAGLNQTAPIFDDAYRSLLEQQRLTVEFEMPLVQWGGRSAQIQAARAEQDRVTALSRESRASVEQDARFAALQLPLARRQLATSAKADTVATGASTSPRPLRHRAATSVTCTSRRAKRMRRC